MRGRYVLKNRTVRDEGFVPFAFGAEKGGTLPFPAPRFFTKMTIYAQKSAIREKIPTKTGDLCILFVGKKQGPC